MHVYRESWQHWSIHTSLNDGSIRYTNGFSDSEKLSVYSNSIRSNCIFERNQSTIVSTLFIYFLSIKRKTDAAISKLSTLVVFDSSFDHKRFVFILCLRSDYYTNIINERWSCPSSSHWGTSYSFGEKKTFLFMFEWQNFIVHEIFHQ